ncbi:hypothetical protein EUGRSUZ_L03186 [Eucalyptus grandis]|uniref:Uncharacterized protein n=1 Tax=Eucalyptus grandis TaxID=71139 RepID=A0AAD9WI17_EUCGR|nr:hypothetical protein EUGRSUZ_L03186 [Eucalyptus grandis]
MPSHLHTSLRPNAASHYSNSSSSAPSPSPSLAAKLLLLLTLLPLSLALLAFALQWRGGVTDPTTRWAPPGSAHLFPGMDNASPLSSVARHSSLSSSSSPSDCAHLARSASPSFPYYRDWKFDFGASLKPKICITTSTSAGLDQILPWMFYHKVIGVTTFFLFVEGKAASPSISKVLESIPGVKVIYRTRELEEQQAKSRIWNETWISSFFYKPCNYELFVKQSLNMEMAIVMARVSIYNALVLHHLRPNGAHRWHNYMKTPNEIKLEKAAVLHYTYAKFSDLTSRRDRCGCKPTKEDVKRCFMLEFDRSAFIIASTATEDEMLNWYHEHVVWGDKDIKIKLLRKGILTRIYAPMLLYKPEGIWCLQLCHCIRPISSIERQVLIYDWWW